MPDPGELEKLMYRAVSEHKARQEAEKKEAAQQAQQAESMRQELVKGTFDASKSAYDLDKQYGQAWDRATLTAMANDPSLSPRQRAKLVEVMLLRGADNNVPYVAMQGMATINGALAEKAAYQMAAVNAVVAGQDKHLFRSLAMSGDQLPSGRLPATELMNVMLQKGGVYGDYEGRQDFEKWMRTLDPMDRGMMMYHVVAAAEATDIAGHGAAVTGFEVGVEPVSFGIQWEGAQDTHWRQVGQDIEHRIATDLAREPSEKAKFYEGYKNANHHLQDPKDFNYVAP